MIESIPVAVCKCPPVVDLNLPVFWCFRAFVLWLLNKGEKK